MNKEELYRLPLGTIVVFSQGFIKEYERRLITERGRDELVTVYRPITKPTTVGAYMGYRFLQEGYTEYTEDSREWIQLGTVLCALVVTGPRKSPTRVPIETLEIL